MHKHYPSTRHAARRHPRARLGARSCRLCGIADANGAMTSDGLRRYEFDAANRLAAMTVGAVDTSPTTRYIHNALGQRLFKTEPQFPPAAGDENDPSFMASLIAFFSQLWGGSAAVAAPSTSEKLGFQYYYDEDGSLLYELGSGGANSSGSTHYVYLPTPAGPLPIATYLGGRHYAVHTDHLGTPRRLSQSNNLPAWQWAFSAFGNEPPTTGKNRYVDPATSPNAGTTTLPDVTFNLRYPGQYFDRESGLSYNYFRSYDSRTGRYTQADPIDLQGGWNKYQYAEGNPLSFVDPLGLCSCEAVESTAKSNLGSNKWNRPEVANTCNEGVYDNLKQSGANAPNRYPSWMGKYPLGAGAGGWSDPKTLINGWTPTTTPRAGDVAAGDGGTGSAHVGIVITRSNGTLGTAGVFSADGLWRETRWPFRSTDKPATYWRCTCK